MASGTRTTFEARDAALHWMDRWVDPLLFFLAATSIPMLIVQTGNPSEGDAAFINRASWFIWGTFTVNFVVRMIVAPDTRAQFKLIGFDLILIVGQPLYSIGDRKADAFIAFLRLVVVAARSLQKGRVLRRTGHKFRSQPLRVVAFIVPFIWLTSGALIYRLETDSGVISSFGDGIWWSAVTMATVGYGDISPKTTEGRAVAILTMIVGIGMFSLVTAKLAELLFIQRTRGTRKEILEKDHTLVLGWSPKLYTIVQQLVIANASRPRASIVILSTRDRNDVLDEVNAHVPALAHSTTTVVVRTGSPSDPADLATCRPDLARSIIVIDDTEEDATVVRTVLALMHAGKALPDIPIVAEIDDPATAAALRFAMGGRITVVNPTTFIARTAAQACRSAGVALAYEDLLGFEGSELYVHREPRAAGARFGELLNAFDDACLIGVRPADGALDLCPPMDIVVGAGDELVLVADDDAGITFRAPGPMPAHARDGEAALVGEHVVVFGWNDLGPLIVRELDGFVPAGSRFTVALDPELCDRDDVEATCGALTNATLSVRRASDAEYADLVEVISEEQAEHAIILCYREDLSVAESDAHALVTTLQVRHAIETRGHDTTVVTELLDQRDVALAPPGAAGEFIVSDHITSLLLTQLAEDRRLTEVFDDLLDPDGAELYCKPAPRYCRSGAPTAFAAIVDAAGALGEAAIGYRLMDAALDAAQNFGVVINPPKAASVTLGPRDQVVVIADHA